MMSTTERPPGQPAGASSTAGTARRDSPTWSDNRRSTRPRAVPSGARERDSTTTSRERFEARTSDKPDSAVAASARIQISLSACGPQHRPREERVLVLPVIPVGPRLHGVDGLGDEAIADGGEGHHAAAAVRPRRDTGSPPASKPRRPSPGIGRTPAARTRGHELEIEAVRDRVRPRAPLGPR